MPKNHNNDDLAAQMARNEQLERENEKLRNENKKPKKPSFGPFFKRVVSSILSFFKNYWRLPVYALATLCFCLLIFGPIHSCRKKESKREVCVNKKCKKMCTIHVKRFKGARLVKSKEWASEQYLTRCECSYLKKNKDGIEWERKYSYPRFLKSLFEECYK